MLVEAVATEVIEFDYEALEVGTRVLVQQRTSEIRAIMRRTAYDAVEIGQKLLEVKAQLGHGKFLKWLEAEFTWAERTAQNYMMVAGKFATVADLDQFAPSALYLLAAQSTPESAVQEALQQASEGKRIDKAEAKAIVEKHKPTLEIGQTTIVEAGEHQGQTVKVLDTNDIFVECQTPNGETFSLLTTELIAPADDAPKSTTPKPSQVSEIIVRLETEKKIDRARIELLEGLLRETLQVVPFGSLRSRIEAVL